MKDSSNDEDTATNILRHIMREEGYQPRVYIDPNWQQANIGYAHSFYWFPKDVLAASRGMGRAAKTKYLLSHIPKQYMLLNWDKKKAQQVLWSDFQKHRAIAYDFLRDTEKANMHNDGRLVDQLGMLFYGSKGNDFMKWGSVHDALRKRDNGRVSELASRFGRTSDGVKLPALAKRRDAERAYYLGKPLPEGKDKADKAPGLSHSEELSKRKPSAITEEVIGADDDVWSRYTPNKARIKSAKPDLFSSLKWDTGLLDPSIPTAAEDQSKLHAEIVGQEGTKRANELVWNVLGDGGPIPDGFDAITFAHKYLSLPTSEQEKTFEPTTVEPMTFNEPSENYLWALAAAREGGNRALASE